MVRWQTLVGIVIGLALGGAILGLLGGRSGPTPIPSGPILSECDGHLRELVLHYEPSAREIVTPTYRDFLGALEADVTAYIVCPARADFDGLVSSLGRVRCKLTPVIVNHPMTTWSRDRWVALAPAITGGPATLWSPRGEAAEEVWPARAGDERIAADLAAALSPAVRARRSDFYFDGGDFLADGGKVFVVPRVLRRNIQHTVGSRADFLKLLSATLKRPLVLLDESPDHHAAMFMMSVGQRRMLVADPALARKILRTETASDVKAGGENPLDLPGGADFSLETQHLFDAVAAQCAAEGCDVLRVPVLPARDGRTCLTYVNVLLDQQGARRIVYLPFYRGVEPLNAAARAIWEQLDYEVRPVDCSRPCRHFGCLHCLVNVLSRS